VACGGGGCCRVIVGMQSVPQEELRQAFSLFGGQTEIDKQTALRLNAAPQKSSEHS